MSIQTPSFPNDTQHQPFEGAGLYEEFATRLRAYLNSILGDEHDAADATHDVFLKAFDSLGKGRVVDDRSAWLFRIARNHALDLLERKRRVTVSSASVWEDPGRSPTAIVTEWITDAKIGAAFDELPSYQRDALDLRFRFDLRAHEVASIRRCSAAAVRQAQARGLRQMRSAIVAGNAGAIAADQ